MKQIHDFIHLVISRYVAEMIVSMLALYLIKLFVSSNLTSLLIIITESLKLEKLNLMLTYKYRKHKVYNSINKMLLNDIFLKHVKNKHYQEYARKILNSVFAQYSTILLERIEQYSKVSLYYTRASMTEKLKEFTIDIRQLMTIQIRYLAENKEIDERFSRKFLVFFEYHMATMISRVNSELRKSKNSYTCLIDYLYIVSDYMNLFEYFFPFIINNINGNIKQNIYTEDEVIEIIERIN